MFKVMAALASPAAIHASDFASCEEQDSVTKVGLRDTDM